MLFAYSITCYLLKVPRLRSSLLFKFEFRILCLSIQLGNLFVLRREYSIAELEQNLHYTISEEGHTILLAIPTSDLVYYFL